MPATPVTPVTARIATVTEIYRGDTTRYQLFYNPDGTLDSLDEAQQDGYRQTSKLTYRQGYILFRNDLYDRRSSLFFYTLDSIRQNDKGLPDTVFESRNGLLSGYETFHYNPAGEIEEIRYHKTSGEQTGRTRFWWQNGNIARSEELGLIINYLYDSSRASQPGEPLLWHTRKNNGTPYFKNKNLATGFALSGIQTTYQYTWQNGLIQTATYTESDNNYYYEYTYY